MLIKVPLTFRSAHQSPPLHPGVLSGVPRPPTSRSSHQRSLLPSCVPSRVLPYMHVHPVEPPLTSTCAQQTPFHIHVCPAESSLTTTMCAQLSPCYIHVCPAESPPTSMCAQQSSPYIHVCPAESPLTFMCAQQSPPSYIYVCPAVSSPTSMCA